MGKLRSFYVTDLFLIQPISFDILVGGTHDGTFDNAVDGVVATADCRGSFTVTYLSSRVRLSNYSPFVVPATVSVTHGTLASGDVEELSTCDSLDFVVQRNEADLQSRIEFELKSVSPIVNPSRLTVRLKGAVFSRAAVTQTIDVFNYTNNTWESVDSRAASRFNDTVAEVSLNGDLSRFVESSSSCITARVRFAGSSQRQQFATYTDQFAWEIE